jgi:hypothetical protein
MIVVVPQCIVRIVYTSISSDYLSNQVYSTCCEHDLAPGNKVYPESIVHLVGFHFGHISIVD